MIICHANFALYSWDLLVKFISVMSLFKENCKYPIPEYPLLICNKYSSSLLIVRTFFRVINYSIHRQSKEWTGIARLKRYMMRMRTP